MMGYEQMNPKTMTTTSMMKNFNKMEPINTPQKKTIRRSVSATDSGAAATACKRRRTSAESQNPIDLNGMVDGTPLDGFNGDSEVIQYLEDSTLLGRALFYST
ncbi:hypothetical protein F2Q69_00046832 [Brassica cretica]|uniref:Uncharacterized protein n=1 Tax=Brassica cretica TaxID=69181 RepID=A0A8S9PUB1_BRACR|nr:hypothetical protein F2Q69_00046832 [Brassica cretica]